jgi:predicted cupin superfamily sugar epimerase
MSLLPKQVIELLGLKAHSTCGFAAETYRSDLQFPARRFPPEYGGSRALGGVLYFLVTPQAPVRRHRIRSDEMYHYDHGDPLEVLLLYPDGKSEVRVVGPDLAAGMRPQLLLPAGTFHAGRVRPRRATRCSVPPCGCGPSPPTSRRGMSVT